MDELNKPPVLPANVNRALATYEKWWREQLKEQENISRPISPLYHYTNGAGLKGILESGKIWLTNAKQLNDPSELHFGYGLAIAALKKQKAPRNTPFGYICERLIEACEGGLLDLFGVYVASFSHKADDLNQWRAYGDNGRGYCLGLAPSAFKIVPAATTSYADHCWLSGVVYGEADAMRRHSTLIKRAGVLLRNQRVLSALAGNVPAQQFFTEQILSLISVGIIWTAMTTKHRAYADEKEVRLLKITQPHKLTHLHHMNPKIYLRPRGSSLVPYTEQGFPVSMRMAARRIIAGPSSEVGAADSASLLLESLNIPRQNRVTRSTIPYRAL